MTSATRKVLPAIRAIHTYLTMFALLGFSFFALTGLMLNHKSWFGLDNAEGGAIRTVEDKADLPTEMLREPDRLAVVEQLRKRFSISAPLTSFDADNDNVSVVFEGPGLRVTAAIARASGQAQVTKMIGSLPALLADLHKGAGGGPWRTALSDAIALLLLVATATGLIIWLSLPHRRKWGLAFVVVGTALYLAVYFLVVPR
jgi:uncharacterized protein